MRPRRSVCFDQSGPSHQRSSVASVNTVSGTRSSMLQNLALRTHVMVLRRIKSECIARQQAIGLTPPISHRNMRNNFPSGINTGPTRRTVATGQSRSHASKFRTRQSSPASCRRRSRQVPTKSCARTSHRINISSRRPLPGDHFPDVGARRLIQPRKRETEIHFPSFSRIQNPAVVVLQIEVAPR